MTDALCPYQGGKRSLLKHLLPLVPEHHCYTEVFCGAAALLFAKEPSPLEVINDINGDLVNAFRCARHHNSALVEEMFLRLNSRQEFRQKHGEGQTDIQRAAEFLIHRSLSFGGNATCFGVTRTGGGGGAATSLARVRSRIERLGDRLDGVSVENLDWRRCLKLYESSKTFFFCDPPYIGTNQSAYESWTAENFAELMDVLRSGKARWLVTINDCPEAKRSLKGVKKVKRVVRARGINNKDGGKRFAELIAMN